MPGLTQNGHAGPGTVHANQTHPPCLGCCWEWAEISGFVPIGVACQVRLQLQVPGLDHHQQWLGVTPFPVSVYLAWTLLKLCEGLEEIPLGMMEWSHTFDGQALSGPWQQCCSCGVSL